MSQSVWSKFEALVAEIDDLYRAMDAFEDSVEDPASATAASDVAWGVRQAAEDLSRELQAYADGA